MEGGRERWGKRGKKGERAKVLGTLDVAGCTSANPKDCRMGWVGKLGFGERRNGTVSVPLTRWLCEVDSRSLVAKQTTPPGRREHARQVKSCERVGARLAGSA